MKHRKGIYQVRTTPESSWGRRIGRGAAMAGIFLAELLLLAVIAVYCVGQMVAHGPSEYAGGLLAGWFAETGVFKKGETFRFVANLFYTEEELSLYEQKAQTEQSAEDPVQILSFSDSEETLEAAADGPVADPWGLVDADGDGLIVEEVKGAGYQGYMMVVLDPSRVIMGADPASFGVKGYSVQAMTELYDGVAGINAGGFEDDGGRGNGSTPNSMVVFDGKAYYGNKGSANGFAGFDSQFQLHVGKFTQKQVEELDIQYGASFGPVLIRDGVVNEKGIKNSGVNPRTAIGQRSDGAVLMLVINGRQSTSIGATYQDLTDVFLAYGAVNACNMDGGSSSLLWYGGAYINNSASLVGVRPVPSTFVVLQEGGSHGG